MKKLSILGSTGSIGTQALEVCREFPDDYKVIAISCNNSIDLMLKQIIEFKPKYAVCYKEDNYNKIKAEVVSRGINIELLSGIEGLKQIASLDEIDIVVSSLVGNIGLEPTIEGIKAGKIIALANKEVLVTSGKLITELAKKHGAKLLPVDSEHSAIFQCIQGNKQSAVGKLILTASGGPFRTYSKDDIAIATVAKALKHPNWSMGKKITIDSATLMNKGLEVIEAKWLFDVDQSDIDVVVHPESIIHSMVEFVDSSVIAQMGLPDMKLPILYSFTYPDRVKTDYARLNLAKIGSLTFEEPDIEKFPCLGLAYEALRAEGTMTTVLNAANEELVNLFINEKIKFYDISDEISNAMSRHNNIMLPSLEDIINVDKHTREEIRSRYSK